MPVSLERVFYGPSQTLGLLYTERFQKTFSAEEPKIREFLSSAWDRKKSGIKKRKYVYLKFQYEQIFGHSLSFIRNLKVLKEIYFLSSWYISALSGFFYILCSLIR